MSLHDTLRIALAAAAVLAALSGGARAQPANQVNAVQYCSTGVNDAFGNPVVAPCGTTAQPIVTTPASSAGAGYDSGAVTGTGAVANSSHAAGTSVGGLITVPVARTNGGSGIITNFMWVSAGGSTGALVIRIWQKLPASTTCTDNSAFVSNATDDAQLITPPFSVVPAAPGITTGDSKTYAQMSQVTWDYDNQSSNTSLYVCAVTVATDTADQNTSVRAMLSGPQN